ncbi:MAG: phage tail protein [Clostridia bacterium]|nr:phage tail protein [Clostridia bacterium]
MTVKPPRLLDANRQPVGILYPARLSLDLPLRDTCTAQIELTDIDPSLAMHDLVHLYTATADVGLYRVTDLTRDSSGQVRATLRHAIDTLSDDVWPVTADAQGNVAPVDFSGTMAEYLAAVLAKQTTVRWQLGTCADTSTWTREGIFFSRLSDLVNEVAQDREEYYFDYDFTTWPWTLNFLALPTQVSGDLRLTRNVDSATVTRSDADMCNKLYLSVTTTTESGGQSSTSVQYKVYNNEASQALYGVIAKTADVDTAYVPDPDAWAQAFLDQRAAPAVQITVDGYELKAQTGMDWDALSRGQRVRVVLGDLERTTTRVEQITYPDVLGQPERVEVQLANRLPSFTETISQMRAVTKAVGGGAGGGGGSGKASADQLKHWAMIVRDTAEAADGTGILQMWQSGIEIDAHGGVNIHSLFQGFESTYQAIDINQEGIRSLVTRADDLETDVDAITGSQLWLQRDNITGTVGKFTIDNDGNVHVIDGSQLYLGTGSASLAVYDESSLTAGIIVDKINGGTVTINAARVNLNGYVTATEFNALQADFNSVVTKSGQAITLRAAVFYLSNTFSYQGHVYAARTINYHDTTTGTDKSLVVLAQST